MSDNKIVSLFFETWGVMFTDAFHFFKMIRDTTLLIAISIIAEYPFIFVFVIVKISYSTIFHIFYNAFKK